ncbi:MAG: UbiA family prenyltransferase [Candidatus Micrarchaeia archaeon]
MPKAMGKLKAILKLTRIEHSIMLLAAVAAAEIITAKQLALVLDIPMIIISFLPPVLISMSAFAINDYYDVNVDRANKKFDRPLVSKELSKEDAFYCAVITALAGVAFSAMININAFVISAIFAALAFLYAYKLKEIALVGNSYVAFAMAIPFLYGNLVTFNRIIGSIAVISITVFLSGLAREIQGTIRDYTGDLERNAKSIAYYAGFIGSEIFAFMLDIAAIALSIWLYAAYQPFKGNILYILPILVVDLALFYLGANYMRVRRGNLNSKKIRRFLKNARNLSLYSMAAAILVYLISAIIFI